MLVIKRKWIKQLNPFVRSCVSHICSPSQFSLVLCLQPTLLFLFRMKNFKTGHFVVLWEVTQWTWLWGGAKKKPWDWVIDITISIELRWLLCALLWDRYANKMMARISHGWLLCHCGVSAVDHFSWGRIPVVASLILVFPLFKLEQLQ